MFSYTAYGLGIHSILPLPELVPAETAAADVVIRLGEVELPPPQDGNARDYAWVTSGAVGLFWENVGAFLVREGREVIVQPAPQSREQVLRLLLLGPILTVLLRQRGFLVLHASAVAVNGAAVGFLGASGSGKSTTTAAFHVHGYELVTDDVTAITLTAEAPLVVAGFPQLKLWPDAVAFFGYDPTTLPQLYPNADKRLSQR